jgi:hypothetical protein
MFRSCSGFLVLISPTLGFCRLTGETERRDTTGGAGTLREEAGPGLSTTVKFTFDVTGSVQMLKVLHVDMAQTSVIEEEILL